MRLEALQELLELMPENRMSLDSSRLQRGTKQNPRRGKPGEIHWPWGMDDLDYIHLRE